jgi:uncharacterized YccA/Bax inhibitor family protein
MRTSNPTLSPNAFNVPSWKDLPSRDSGAGDAGVAHSGRVMTLNGTVNASFILISLTIASAMGGWYAIQNKLVSPMPIVLAGLFGGLGIGLVLMFSQKLAPFLAPIYAIVKGAFLGAISLFTEQQLQAKIGPAASGVVFQAVVLTFGIFFSLLVAYKFKLIRLSQTVQTCVMIGTAGVGLLYIASMLMSAMGFGSIGFIHSSGSIGIGFSLFVVLLASFNLVMDFQFIDENANRGLPKYMEWYAAFGLLTTLVWLYIEILRLLAKLASRRE